MKKEFRQILDESSIETIHPKWFWTKCDKCFNSFKQEDMWRLRVYYNARKNLFNSLYYANTMHRLKSFEYIYCKNCKNLEQLQIEMRELKRELVILQEPELRKAQHQVFW